MTSYRIVCKALDDNEEKIVKLGLVKIEPGHLTDKATSQKTPKEINNRIKHGDEFFVIDEEDNNVHVVKFGKGFIQINPGGMITNNLSHLRNCRKFKMEY